MVKKTVINLFVILLTGCQFFNNEKAVDAFNVNEKCPHICWLGLNPEKTTVEEAKRILNASDQIDHKQTEISETGIYTNWLGVSGTFSIPINIVFENDRVKTISLGELPVTVNDFIELLGQPDKISILNMNGADEANTPYVIYYQAQNTMIISSGNLQIGPEPDNVISNLTLNTYIDVSSSPPEWAVFQPWLGYGHLKDYLPELKSP